MFRLCGRYNRRRPLEVSTAQTTWTPCQSDQKDAVTFEWLLFGDRREGRGAQLTFIESFITVVRTSPKAPFKPTALSALLLWRLLHHDLCAVTAFVSTPKRRSGVLHQSGDEGLMHLAGLMASTSLNHGLLRWTLHKKYKEAEAEL